MRWKALACIVLLLSGLILAETTIRRAGKIIVAADDTMIVRDIEEEEGEFEEVIDDIDQELEEIFEELDLDETFMTRDEIHTVVKQRVEETLKEANLPYHADFDLERSYRMDKKKPLVFLGMLFFFTWRLVFLVMWIITLFVIGRGFTRIARALKERKEE